MIAILTIAAVELITLHMIDGRIVQINPKQVTQLISALPTTDNRNALPDAVQCLIRLTDGSFLSVAESCIEVNNMMVKP